MTGTPQRTFQVGATFRPYTPADLNACLALFDSNYPPYFHPSEREGYRAFLEDTAAQGEYFVLEHGTEVRPAEESGSMQGAWAG